MSRIWSTYPLWRNIADHTVSWAYFVWLFTCLSACRIHCVVLIVSLCFRHLSYKLQVANYMGLIFFIIILNMFRNVMIFHRIGSTYPKQNPHNFYQLRKLYSSRRDIFSTAFSRLMILAANCPKFPVLWFNSIDKIGFLLILVCICLQKYLH